MTTDWRAHGTPEELAEKLESSARAFRADGWEPTEKNLDAAAACLREMIEHRNRLQKEVTGFRRGARGQYRDLKRRIRELEAQQPTAPQAQQSDKDFKFRGEAWPVFDENDRLLAFFDEEGPAKRFVQDRAHKQALRYERYVSVGTQAASTMSDKPARITFHDADEAFMILDKHGQFTGFYRDGNLAEHSAKVRGETVMRWVPATALESAQSELAEVRHWNERVSVCPQHTGDIIDGDCLVCELAEARRTLDFVWRWIDRLQSGKPDDEPEVNWKDYVSVLVHYPASPYKTEGWPLGSLFDESGAIANPDTETNEAQLAEARERGRRLREALDEIASPISAMQRRAAETGDKLDGVAAVSIGSDPEYLKRIARAALADDTEAGDG